MIEDHYSVTTRQERDQQIKEVRVTILDSDQK